MTGIELIAELMRRMTTTTTATVGTVIAPRYEPWRRQLNSLDRYREENARLHFAPRINERDAPRENKTRLSLTDTKLSRGRLSRSVANPRMRTSRLRDDHRGRDFTSPAEESRAENVDRERCYLGRPS